MWKFGIFFRLRTIVKNVGVWAARQQTTVDIYSPTPNKTRVRHLYCETWILDYHYFPAPEAGQFSTKA